MSVLADVVLRGGPELLTLDDPLDAETWASHTLGAFYKLDVPLPVRDEIEQKLWPAVIQAAEKRADRPSLAILEALAAVADDEPASNARGAGDRLRARGVEPPQWADELGSAVFEGAWRMCDVFGDHEAYFATFRYPGRKPHVVNALYDKAMGEIIKDGYVAYPLEDARARADREDGLWTEDAEPDFMARRVSDAIDNGDLYLDNDWSPSFREFRALIRARMRSLPMAPPIEPAETLGDAEREVLIAEFLATTGGRRDEAAELIASYCLDYTCDYLGEGPFRWSPIVVEQFLLDYVPRKVSLSLREVRQVPAVLRAWVRFCLAKRGLEERWIAEAEAAVDQHAKEFRRASTDATQFGPAKQIGQLMLADGVDLADQSAIDRWIAGFNARPFEERDVFLGGASDEPSDR